MAKTYFGFAVADGMFSGDAVVTRRILDAAGAKSLIEAAKAAGSFESAINASHVPTVEAMASRFGLEVEVPAIPPKIVLGEGDAFVVMSVRGLARLEGRTQYTEDEIAKATFTFAIWQVLGHTTYEVWAPDAIPYESSDKPGYGIYRVIQ